MIFHKTTKMVMTMLLISAVLITFGAEGYEPTGFAMAENSELLNLFSRGSSGFDKEGRITYSLDKPGRKYHQGEELTLNVRLNMNPSESVAAFELRIVYDENVLELVDGGIVFNQDLQKPGVILDSDNRQDEDSGKQHIFLFYSAQSKNNAISADASIANITFTIKHEVGVIGAHRFMDFDDQDSANKAILFGENDLEGYLLSSNQIGFVVVDEDEIIEQPFKLTYEIEDIKESYQPGEHIKLNVFLEDENPTPHDIKVLGINVKYDADIVTPINVEFSSVLNDLEDCIEREVYYNEPEEDGYVYFVFIAGSTLLSNNGDSILISSVEFEVTQQAQDDEQDMEYKFEGYRDDSNEVVVLGSSGKDVACDVEFGDAVSFTVAAKIVTPPTPEYNVQFNTNASGKLESVKLSKVNIDGGVVIIHHVRGNKLMNAYTKAADQLQWDANGVATLNITSVFYRIPTGDKIKVMIWEDVENMVPMLDQPAQYIEV